MKDYKYLWEAPNLTNTLKNDGVVVMPTDTLYGIVGQALNSSVVQRIYKLRKRNPKKPCIILVGDVNELEKFKIKLSNKQKEIVEKYFFSPTSVILDCPDESFAYLHRGTKTLAFRLPASPVLRDLLLKTGPLVAPSANTEALPPSKNILEAKKYFGDSVDLYMDGGVVSGKASRVIRLQSDGSISIIRE